MFYYTLFKNMELFGVLCILFIITFVICFLLYESIDLSTRLDNIEYFIQHKARHQEETHVKNNNMENDIEKGLQYRGSNHLLNKEDQNSSYTTMMMNAQPSVANDTRNMNSSSSSSLSYRRPIIRNSSGEYSTLRR